MMPLRRMRKRASSADVGNGGPALQAVAHAKLGSLEQMEMEE